MGLSIVDIFSLFILLIFTCFTIGKWEHLQAGFMFFDTAPVVFDKMISDVQDGTDSHLTFPVSNLETTIF